MNDQSKDQSSIEYNTNDTKKRKFGDTLNLVWMDTIEYVISELERCLNPLQQDMENRTLYVKPPACWTSYNLVLRRLNF